MTDRMTPPRMSPTLPGTARSRSWSRDAVIYQIYVRSFADSDGDGIGDLPGITARLDHIVDLGVDAIWLTPFYPSPMADGGYDVADFRDVDPLFGTLADFDELLAQAHRRGLRVIIDVVPNHVSSRHPWFQAALAAGPGSPERALFHFRPGVDGAPPNDWQSVFHGPAWTQVPDGDWYLHLFAPEQPDLNWDDPRVRAEFDGVLRFWLDRGVDGIRVDVAHGLVKAPGLPDVGHASALLDGAATPFFDQDGVHEIYRHWRSILDSYEPERVAVAEAWAPVARTARYVRPDELHQAFNFDFLGTAWSGAQYRRVIDESLAAMDAVGAPATWVLSNHDVVRHASRLAAGRGGSAGGASAGAVETAADRALGLRRARAATLLLLALPGSVYLYQGEELGLPEVFDLPADARQDPIFGRTQGAELGRDGCRVPLPWSGEEPPYGFGPPGSRPWLPQPAAWAALTVQAQRDDPQSTLQLYRVALHLRRQRGELGDGALRWRSAPGEAVLAFERPGRTGTRSTLCVVNLSAEAVPAPVGKPLVVSEPLVDGMLPPDTAGWWDVEDA
jgi:alpha-glucosidase